MVDAAITFLFPLWGKSGRRPGWGLQPGDWTQSPKALDLAVFPIGVAEQAFVELAGRRQRTRRQSGSWFGDERVRKCFNLAQIITAQVIPPERHLRQRWDRPHRPVGEGLEHWAAELIRRAPPPPLRGPPPPKS